MHLGCGFRLCRDLDSRRRRAPPSRRQLGSCRLDWLHVASKRTHNHSRSAFKYEVRYRVSVRLTSTRPVVSPVELKSVLTIADTAQRRRMTSLLTRQRVAEAAACQTQRRCPHLSSSSILVYTVDTKKPAHHSFLGLTHLYDDAGRCSIHRNGQLMIGSKAECASMFKYSLRRIRKKPYYYDAST